MKKTNTLLVFGGILIVFSQSLAFAAGTRKGKSTYPDTTYSAPQSYNYAQADPYSGHEKEYGFGIAAMEGLTFTSTALTWWQDLDDKNMLQALLAIPSTRPFQISVGALIKHTIVEGQNAGLHFGGGLGLGNTATGANTTAFALAIAMVGGIHVQFPGAPKLRISVDGGPVLNIVNNSADFAIGGVSPAMGLTLAYMIN